MAPSLPRPPSPITSGALNSCSSPGCLSQGPPGCRVTAHGAAGTHPMYPAPCGRRRSRAAGSRCMHPPPTPAPCMHRGTSGTPRLAVSCVHSTRLEGWGLSTGHRSIPPAVPLTHAVADPESPVPSWCHGDADAQVAWKISSAGIQNGQRCLPPCHAVVFPPAHGD